ncbi:BglG family transcription antiterminator [Domibacillus tundrae]|uniref:BglG family transcription antiterminator n=1 Tax=Domibacillus tundrae TaxID=1587527 RepID=UPI000617CD2E|nr:BglG family transcription antiterminator [Domibacillus tundrae]
MYLDERSNQILEDVLGNPEISNAELEDKYALSRRQIGYSFTKINDWLEQNSYPAIKRTKSGKFLLSPILMELLVKRPAAQTQSTYILSEKERTYVIILMILGSSEELSLIHFSIGLDVSKNTILRDMKHVQEIVGRYDLEIVYSRLNGYVVSGREWDKRRLLVDALRKIFDIYKGESYIYQFGGIAEEDVQKLQKQIEDVEERLQLQFSDERMRILPYIIAILLKRVKNGHTIDGSHHIDYEALSDTKEYEAAELLIKDELEELSKEERLFFALQLLTSNVLTSQLLTDHEIPHLKEALAESLSLFERQACITLKDKSRLLEKLFLHMKPAYYRIKYHLTTNYFMIEKVSEEFEAIHYIVKDSIKPLEEYIGCEIPESEIMFVTVFIGGHLINSGETIPLKKKAVVVCPNGVSISNLMDNTLRELFPEFYFHRALSIREFQQMDDGFDLVFSPVPLQTNKQLFIVHHFISELEKMTLRQRVMKEVFSLQMPVINVDQLMNTIAKYADIKDPKQLERSLESYFTQPNQQETKVKADYGLPDFIHPDMIVMEEEAGSWHEAIERASQPLLEGGFITADYIKTMKQQYPSISPHILLRMNVAIPHAAPEHGVQRVGMSLLKLKKGLSFDKNHIVHFVVVIAAVDKSQHLNALLQLMKLADKKDVIHEMTQMDSAQAIHEVLKHHTQP